MHLRLKITKLIVMNLNHMTKITGKKVLENIYIIDFQDLKWIQFIITNTLMIFFINKQ